jgi:sugar lactone lactonase YvrE
MDAQGDLWCPEWGGGAIVKLTAAGRRIGSFGTPGHERGSLLTPWGIAVRPNGTVVIADTGNRRVVEVSWQ